MPKENILIYTVAAALLVVWVVAIVVSIRRVQRLSRKETVRGIDK